MADFTVEGIIDVDASRGIRGVRKFKNELKTLLTDLRAVSKEIDKLDGKEIDVKVKADSASIKKLKTELESIQDVTVQIDVDTDALDAAAELAANIQAIEQSADDIDLDIGLDSPMDEFEKLHAEMMALAESSEINMEVELAGQADTINDARKLRQEVEAALEPNPDLTVDINYDEEAFRKFKEDLNGISASGRGLLIGGLLAAIIGLVATLGPLAAGFLAASAGIVGGLSVLTVAIGAFAVFAAPAFMEVKDALELLNTETAGMDDEELRAYNKQLRELKKNQPALYNVATHVNKLKNEWKELAREIRPEMFRIMHNGLSTASTLMGYLIPIADEVADAFVNLSEDMDKALKGEDWANFFKYVEENAQGFVEGFFGTMGNFLTGFANLVVAFDPLTKQLGGGFSEMSENFLKWSQGLEDNEGFQKFLSYMQEQGPKVWDLLKEMGVALGNTLVNLAPLGEEVIEFVTNMSEMYNEFTKTNPEGARFATWLGAALIVALPLAGSLGSLLAPIGSLAGGLGSIMASKGVPGLLGGTGTAAGGAAGGIGAAATAAGALLVAIVGIAGILAFTERDTEEYTKMMENLKDVWETIKDVGSNIVDIFVDMWDILKDSSAAENFQNAFADIADTFERFLPLLEPIAMIIGGALLAAILGISYAFEAFWGIIDRVTSFLEPIINGIVSLFQWLYDVLVGNSIIPDLVNGIIDWFAKLPGEVLGAIAGLPGMVVDKFVDMAANVIGKLNNLREQGVQKFSELKSRISSIISNIPSILGEKFQAAKEQVVQKLENMKEGGLEKIRDLKTKAGEIAGNVKDAIVGKFDGALTWLTQAGKNIVQGLIDGLEAMLDRLLDVVARIKAAAASAGGGGYKSGGPPSSGGPSGGGGGREPAKRTREIVSRIAEIQAMEALRTIDVPTSLDGYVGKVLSGGVSAGGHTTVNYHNWDVKVPVGATAEEVGRELKKYIDAYEETGGW